MEADHLGGLEIDRQLLHDDAEKSMKLRHRRKLLAFGRARCRAASRIAHCTRANLSDTAGAFGCRPAPGGGVDIPGRLIGHWLAERLGQPFIIENRPGAGTNIGTEVVVKAPPDGYTLLVAATPNAINATLCDNLNFNFIRDTTPVASIGRSPLVIVVNPSFPAKTVPEFIAYAKPIQERSVTRLRALILHSMWRPRCSKLRPASTWFTSRIEAWDLHSRICLPGRCT